MKKSNKFLVVVSTFVLAFGLSGIVMAATAANLGTADSFAVLAGSTITNTGTTVVNGDLGLSPGTSVTGFPPGIVNGTQYVTDATAAQAQLDLVIAYDNLVGQTTISTIPAELGGTTENAGVYESVDGSFGITGTVTLDGEGNSDAVFIFKTASTLITGGSSIVNLINEAQACNVFWQVGSSATLGTDSIFKGSILALTSATLTTGANVEGRILTRDGAVTLDTNTVTKPSCVVDPVPEVTAVPAGGGAPTGVFTPHVISSTGSSYTGNVVEIAVVESDVISSTGSSSTEDVVEIASEPEVIDTVTLAETPIIDPVDPVEITTYSSPRLPNTGFEQN